MANIKDVLRTQRWLGCDAARRTQQFTSDYNSFMRYPKLGGVMDCHAPTGLRGANRCRYRGRPRRSRIGAIACRGSYWAEARSSPLSTSGCSLLHSPSSWQSSSERSIPSKCIRRSGYHRSLSVRERMHPAEL